MTYPRWLASAGLMLMLLAFAASLRTIRGESRGPHRSYRQEAEEQRDPTPTPRFQFVKRAQIAAGIAAAIATYRGFVVMSVHDELRLVDVSDRLNPKVVSAIKLGGFITCIAISEHYAYVAAGTSGVQIVDLGDPADLRTIGSVPPSEPFGESYLVALNGTLAYVVEDVTLRVIDVSDVAHPRPLGQTDFLTPTGSQSDIAYAGGYIFVTAGEYILVFDVSIPDAPKQSFAIPRSGRRNWHGITIRDNLAFVGAQCGGLVVFDVSNPAQPKELSELPLPCAVRKPVLVGTALYLPGGDSGLHVIDVSNPMTPRLLGSIDTSGDAWIAAANQDTVFLADIDVGLYVIDVSSPSSPRILSTIEDPSPSTDVEVVGDTAYVLTGVGRLLIYDISTLSSPRLIGKLTISDSTVTSGLAAVGSVVYTLIPPDRDQHVAPLYSKLAVIDVSTPSNPKILSRLSLPHSTRPITISGDRAYVGGYDGLVILDVADPVHPYVIGRYFEKDVSIGGIVADGVFAYVLGIGNGIGSSNLGPGLMVLRISDPEAITVEAELYDDRIRFPRSIARSETDVAIGGERGLSFIDIRDPRAPRIRQDSSTREGFKGVSAVASAGDYIYATSEGARALRMFDIFDPYRPRVVGSYDLESYSGPSDIAIKGNIVALAAGPLGVIFLERIDLFATPSPTPTVSPTPVPTPSPTPTVMTWRVFCPNVRRFR